MRHYGRICPRCGAFLDPGESCDCEREKEAVQRMTPAFDTTVKEPFTQDAMRKSREKIHV